MNTKWEKHDAENILGWAADFPYVNGALFLGFAEIPIFRHIAQRNLFHIGNLD